MRLYPILIEPRRESRQRFSPSGSWINASLRAMTSAVGIGNDRTRSGETRTPNRCSSIWILLLIEMMFSGSGLRPLRHPKRETSLTKPTGVSDLVWAVVVTLDNMERESPTGLAALTQKHLTEAVSAKLSEGLTENRAKSRRGASEEEADTVRQFTAASGSGRVAGGILRVVGGALRIQFGDIVTVGMVPTGTDKSRFARGSRCAKAAGCAPVAITWSG